MDLKNTISTKGAVLGSWFSTPRPMQLNTLLTMYGNGSWDPDDNKFTKSIMQLDLDRHINYRSKANVANDLDNIFDDQHQICAINNLGHSSGQELGFTDKERATKECYANSADKREYYALSWDDIEEAADDDVFLVDLRTALIANDVKALALP